MKRTDRNLVWVAALAGFVLLTAQMTKWHGVSINIGGTSDVARITFTQRIGAPTGNFDIITGPATNQFGSGTAAGSNVVQVNASGIVTNPASIVFTNGSFSGNALGLTNVYATRWAVFTIPMWRDGESTDYTQTYYDVHLKGSTNFFSHYNEGAVFKYTTSDPAFNGSPEWEQFDPANPPLAYMSFGADWMTHLEIGSKHICLLNTNSANGIWDNFSHWGDWYAPVFNVEIWVPGNATLHPTNRITWIYLRVGPTQSEQVTMTRSGSTKTFYYWRAIEPVWTDREPPHHWFINY